MSRPGFAEEQQPFDDRPASLMVGQFRRLGHAGPAYEIMEVDEDGTVHVEVVHSAERLIYPMAEVAADPIADTLP